MGETFNKKEKEKKRLKERQEKKEKMQERKANATKKSLDDMMAYLDENGNISSTPPDPRKKIHFKQEDIQISPPKYVPGEEANPIIRGVVTFFNHEKGFGFIKDSQTGESIFVHANALSEPVQENNILQFEVEMGPKGLNAINAKKAK